MPTFARLAALLLLPACLGLAPARAATLTTFDFKGDCVDCAGVGIGRLTLTDYTLGATITPDNFVSFAYLGTNLLAAYTIQAGQESSIDGAIAPPLPGTENFFIFGNGENFSTFDDGFWCTGGGCLLDYGDSHAWSLAATSDPAGTTVPEPSSLALLGAGLAGTAILRRRQRDLSAGR